MIGKMTYQQIIDISNQLEQALKEIEEVSNKYGVESLTDFISTVEGYSKYLTTTVELNEDADEVLKELKSKIK